MEKGMGLGQTRWIFISHPYAEFQWKSQLVVAEPEVKAGKVAAKKRGIYPGIGKVHPLLTRSSHPAGIPTQLLQGWLCLVP